MFRSIRGEKKGVCSKEGLIQRGKKTQEENRRAVEEQAEERARKAEEAKKTLQIAEDLLLRNQ